jgi:hypothetical protein
VLAIVLAREHAGELHGLDGLLDGEAGLLRFLERALVAGFLAELEQDLGVLERLLLLLPALGLGALRRLLLQQALGAGLIVPEVGGRGELVDLRRALACAVDVKDAPGARRACLRGSRSCP